MRRPAQPVGDVALDLHARRTHQLILLNALAQTACYLKAEFATEHRRNQRFIPGGTMARKGPLALGLYVGRLTALSELGIEERDALVRMPHQLTTYRAGFDIVRPDKRSDDIPVVVGGFVCSFAQRRNGTRQATSLYLRGDLVNPASVMLPILATGLQAFSDTVLLHIPRAILQDIIMRYPAVAHAMHRECAIQLGMQAKWTEIVGRGSAASRLAHLLCEIATRQNDAEPSDGVSFELPLTQQQMAEAIAISSVHLNRTIQVFRREGLLNVINHVVTIPKWQQFCTIAQFDPRYLRYT